MTDEAESAASPAGGMTEPPGPGHQAAMESPERTLAFRALYDAHVDFVWRNLRRLGISAAEVDDRTQEVFVVAHRRWDGFEDLGHGPRAWLFQIVLRVVSDARRHRRRHPEDADGGYAESRRSEPPPQLDEMARKEALEQLDRALATIDMGRRAVLVLHEIEEMTAPGDRQGDGPPAEHRLFTPPRGPRGAQSSAPRRRARGGPADRPSGPVLLTGPGAPQDQRAPRDDLRGTR